MKTLIDMSITSTVIALIIIFMRYYISKRNASHTVYKLWAILFIHLLIPISVTSSMSLFNYIELPSIQSPQVDYIPSNFEANTVQTLPSRPPSPSADHRLPSAGTAIDEISQEALNPSTGEASKPSTSTFKAFTFFKIIWAIVAAIIIASTLLLQVIYSKKFHEAVLYSASTDLVNRARKRVDLRRTIKIYSSPHVNTPLVFGFIKVKIILPSTFLHECTPRQMDYVICHEMVHIKRFDYLTKPLSFMLLALHWFNPILWISYLLAQVDMEKSCDQRVLQAFEEDIRADYARSLVDLAVTQNSLSTTLTLAFGKSHIKSRVEGVMKTRKKAKHLSIVITILLFLLAGILLTGKIEPTKDSAFMSSDVTYFSHQESDPLNKALKIVMKAYIEDGASATASDTYQYILTHTEASLKTIQEEIEYLSQEGDEIPPSNIGQKIAYEWLMSSIIKSQVPDEKNIRTEDTYTIVTSDDCQGKLSPTTSSETLQHINQGTVIQITGAYTMDWFLAKPILLQGQTQDEKNKIFMEATQVNFWIHADDLQYSVIGDDDIWSYFTDQQVHVSALQKFNYLISEDVPLMLLPDSNGHVIGKLKKNDRISIKKDALGQPIHKNGYALVGQFDDHGDSSVTGWIKATVIDALEDKTFSNQAYLPRTSMLYATAHSNTAYTFKDKEQNFRVFPTLQPVKIVDRKNGRCCIENYRHPGQVWVSTDHLVFKVSDALVDALVNPIFDGQIFVDTLKDNILNNPKLLVQAKDLHYQRPLTQNERIDLANALSSIDHIKRSDGGINPNQEAIFPFYTLDFSDYTMVLTSNHALLLDMDTEYLYKYGLGSEGPPVSWLRPNRAFIDKIMSFIDPSAFFDSLYLDLFNAKALEIYNADEVLTSATKVAKNMNLWTRTLGHAMGPMILIEDPNINITDQWTYTFIFEETSISVVHTNRYIFMDGVYYESLIPPQITHSTIVAG